MKRYEGSRAGDDGTAIIVVDGDRAYPLPWLDQHEHERRYYHARVPTATTASQRTFEWSYEGTGPADTAAAILADFYGIPQPAGVVQAFKRDVVARLPREGRWTLTAERIDAWVAANVEAFARGWEAVDAYERDLALADAADPDDAAGLTSEEA